MGQTKNRSSEKFHKKTNRTNIIATNFVWEQLNKDWENFERRKSNWRKMAIAFLWMQSVTLHSHVEKYKPAKAVGYTLFVIIQISVGQLVCRVRQLLSGEPASNDTIFPFVRQFGRQRHASVAAFSSTLLSSIAIRTVACWPSFLILSNLIVDHFACTYSTTLPRNPSWCDCG